MTAGDRSQNYQLGFTEPFLFDRNITGGFDIYKRSLQYIGYYTQKSRAGTSSSDSGGQFQPDVLQLLVRNDAHRRPQRSAHRPVVSGARRPDVRSSRRWAISGALTPTQVDISAPQPVRVRLAARRTGRVALDQQGRPSFVHNTVDNPIFTVDRTRRPHGLDDLAVLGGNTHFYKPRIEGIMFFRHTSRPPSASRARRSTSPRSATGLRVTPPATTCVAVAADLRAALPRRRVQRPRLRHPLDRPTVPGSPIVLGGNKSLLFNAEYMFSIRQPGAHRGVLRRRPGAQLRRAVRVEGRSDADDADHPAALDPFAHERLIDPTRRRRRHASHRRTSAFKTSTGLELRFFMPVLNVPFRLIYSFNPQRAGVLDNNLQPAKETRSGSRWERRSRTWIGLGPRPQSLAASRSKAQAQAASSEVRDGELVRGGLRQLADVVDARRSSCRWPSRTR
jgi:hypothetical protein